MREPRTRAVRARPCTARIQRVLRGPVGAAGPLAGLPLSIIWGMRDTAFGPAILERWTDAFPQARVTRIRDAGHWPHEEQPELVLAALKGTV